MVVRSSNSTQGRISSLDGFRGVAISFVVIHHLAPTDLTQGSVGVDLFFALSGYLLTSILLKEFAIRGTISFKNFYLRRTARILPPLILLLMVVGAAKLLSHHSPVSWKEILFAGTYTMNWIRALGIGDSSLLGHTWSLGVQEQFYLLWPPILLGALRWKTNSAPIFAIGMATMSAVWSIVLYLQGAPVARSFNGFDTRAVELFIGSALAFFPLDCRLANLLAKLWYIPAVAVVVELCLTTTPLIPMGSYGILGLLAAWLVLASLKETSLAVRLENPVLVYIGRVSYGIYLWHYTLLRLFEVHSPHHKFVVDVLVLAGTLAIAAVSYHFVETPILRATRRITIGLRKAVPTSEHNVSTSGQDPVRATLAQEPPLWLGYRGLDT